MVKDKLLFLRSFSVAKELFPRGHVGEKRWRPFRRYCLAKCTSPSTSGSSNMSAGVTMLSFANWLFASSNRLPNVALGFGGFVHRVLSVYAS